MGGRGGSSGLGSGSPEGKASAYADKNIKNVIPNEKEFKINKVPNLEGSEKQIKWATDIRREILKELSGYANEHDVMKNVIKGRDTVINDIKNRFVNRGESLFDSNNRTFSTMSKQELSARKNSTLEGAARPYIQLAERIKRLNKIASEKSSKWWIEHRSYDEKRKLREYIEGKRKEI